MWVVVVLVAALVATSAALVVLATNESDGRSASRPMMQPGGQGPWQMPVAGDDGRGWNDGRGPDLLPWLLFAIATGTSVGLLIAWSPWRRTPAPVTTSAGAFLTPAADPITGSPVGATAPAEVEAPVQVTAPIEAETAHLVETAAVEVTTAQRVEAVTEPSVPEADDLADAAGTETTGDSKPREHDPGADTA
jgi:hypothetical protein